jgi:hypothetical protein
MVDKRGKVYHFLGDEQKKMGQLRRPLYGGVSLEQAYELVS